MVKNNHYLQPLLLVKFYLLYKRKLRISKNNYLYRPTFVMAFHDKFKPTELF